MFTISWGLGELHTVGHLDLPLMGSTQAKASAKLPVWTNKSVTQHCTPGQPQACSFQPPGTGYTPTAINRGSQGASLGLRLQAYTRVNCRHHPAATSTVTNRGGTTAPAQAVQELPTAC